MTQAIVNRWSKSKSKKSSSRARRETSRFAWLAVKGLLETRRVTAGLHRASGFCAITPTTLAYSRA